MKFHPLERNLGNREMILQSFTMRISDLLLLEPLPGYMDVMRVYTTSESRYKVKRAAESILLKEGFVSKVSM